MPGTLYVVATPIGNLEDITLRALRVLREVSLIAAEDTRVTRKILTRFEIATPMLSYNEHNAAERTRRIVEALAQGDVALVSDAGVPLVSDPGADLVGAALAAGARVEAVPGPSAVTTALAVAGMPADRFRFLGFPPRVSKQRRALLREHAPARETLVLFEAPHRVRETLSDLREALGDRRVAVCRELTKLHEEVFRGTLGAALEHFATPRGEFVLVVAGADEPAGATTERSSPEDVQAALARLKASGVSAKDATEQMARALGLPRREAYRLWLALD
ncbi:MAG: 16S rRNA (cytidine(1402)-2'-O)-methyltransferase [SAR202 cluster bacterium]|nr:16S rRNA (cytidine(1402)-2'-O)-methyltransferase [SAR202 cluster bacterium]